MDDTGVIRRTDYDAPENERESETQVLKHEARKFLKAVIHELDALFWDEDLSDAGPDDFDPYIDLLPEFHPGFNDDESDTDEKTADEQGEQEEARQPLWSLRLELNTGQEKLITFYNHMHDGPQGLYWSLMEWFASVCGDDSDGDGEPFE
jgi:hypothetical protein